MQSNFKPITNYHNIHRGRSRWCGSSDTNIGWVGIHSHPGKTSGFSFNPDFCLNFGQEPDMYPVQFQEGPSKSNRERERLEEREAKKPSCFFATWFRRSVICYSPDPHPSPWCGNLSSPTNIGDLDSTSISNYRHPIRIILAK